MISKSLTNILVHLRLPFSLFLAPVYFFALSESAPASGEKALGVFFILHFLLFPASNAYNSYYDRDEGSIGLIRHPPPTSRGLLYTAILMDAAAIAGAAWLRLGWFFTVYVVLYGLVSKAYSHPAIRLKRYPVTSLLVVALFQGLYTFIACRAAISRLDLSDLNGFSVLFPALLCSINLIAVYPLTQVYQHEEDEKHGDLTYSRLVGIRGTFLHAVLFFSLSFCGFTYWYLSKGQPERWLLFNAFMLPAVVYLSYWWFRVKTNHMEANYSHTMRFNALASAGLNVFFICLILLNRSI